MKKIIRLAVLIALGFGISGCTYHEGTLNYAKKNNLSENFYSDVKIQCITDQKLDLKEINSNITKVIAKSMFDKCDYDSRSMRKTRPAMGMMKYRACMGLAGSTNIFNKSENINKNITIKHTISRNMYKEKEYGYWGIDFSNEASKGKLIVFSNGDIEDTALENYFKNNNLNCDTIK